MRKKRHRGSHFGHPTFIYDDEYPTEEIWLDSPWRYEDTGELVRESPPRPCAKCKGFMTEDGHDPCIANLPGVTAACCGHGSKPGYVMFEDRTILDGEFCFVLRKQTS